MKNLIRGISENGGVVFVGLDSTRIVREMERLHKTSAVASAALGRLLTGASMMGIMQKNTEDSVTLRLNGKGPAGTLLAVAQGDGMVKGYIENPVIELPLREDGHLNVGAAVGTDGVLSVVRDLGFKQPTIGQVPIVTGEIAEDITSYYAVSEQVPTVCALGVLVAPDCSIACAGGYLVQLLPGATDAEIDRLEENIKRMPAVTELLQEGKTPEDIMMLALDGFNPNLLDSYEVDYRCDCGEERVERILRSLGKEELTRLCDEDPIAQVDCQFCGKHYKTDLKKILEKI